MAGRGSRRIDDGLSRREEHEKGREVQRNERERKRKRGQERGEERGREKERERKGKTDRQNSLLRPRLNMALFFPSGQVMLPVWLLYNGLQIIKCL